MLPSSLLARCSSSAPRIPSALPALSRRYVTKSTPRPLLGRYDHVPIELARVQSGNNVTLRDYQQQKALKRFSYDLKLNSDGVVSAASRDNYIGPNGCTLRPPLSPTFQENARSARGYNILVYVLKEGTPLPKTLTILHEHSDVYSIQCVEPMALGDLNAELTKFINEHGRMLNKEQFDAEFPFTI
ncbi:uncharacterized protein C8Q71DRAFT_746822 [Rhodofomes roseus]|uniref:Tse2 ADP-ribosyltransferase toxin domain-containing protein n=1 Tax=Rhodofomes roseus TaxID=34475 RepID=A0ABQ8KQ26_9APHY|nr:uncharacterized protein C8Q71DRAFT_746822 [Rhodofomes roseus]KAH9840293.1 hypothetical protein C8Q71DRAFT_746822 [Rhodofomes roseus]